MKKAVRNLVNRLFVIVLLMVAALFALDGQRVGPFEFHVKVNLTNFGFADRTVYRRYDVDRCTYIRQEMAYTIPFFQIDYGTARETHCR